MTRVVVLVSGKRVRRYPLPPDAELQDEYIINDERWTVTAVLATEDVELTNPLTQVSR